MVAAIYLKAYLWLLYFILAVWAVLILLDYIRFIWKRILFWVRLKRMRLPFRGLHPLWLFFSLPHRADFLITAKSGKQYAVRFVEVCRRCTTFALPDANYWYTARTILLPGVQGFVRLQLSFKRKWFGMDFRRHADKCAPDADPVWLFYPKPLEVISSSYDVREKRPSNIREFNGGQYYEDILILDGNTFTNLVTCQNEKEVLGDAQKLPRTSGSILW